MNIDSSQFITGREVAVLDMLNARDRRHAIQQELIRTHNATVISFTLNIPGPIKVFPLGEMTFEEGIRLIDSQLHAWKIPVLEKRTIRDFTGNEQFWSVKGDTLFIKEILCLLEDSLSFGRLFDIDVIRTDETKVSRTELGFPGRKCLLCSNDAPYVRRTRSVRRFMSRALLRHASACTLPPRTASRLRRHGAANMPEKENPIVRRRNCAGFFRRYIEIASANGYNRLKHMPAVRISAGVKFEKGRYYHENNPHTEQSGADGRIYRSRENRRCRR